MCQCKDAENRVFNMFLYCQWKPGVSLMNVESCKAVQIYRKKSVNLLGFKIKNLYS